ncbi:MAG TPA: VWA domain-containing protein [Acidobacteriaceae bacterium]|jgi:VWFA-related protein|nr:VWA domain-containing protein [Acidobacteriaceae bacterium]
MYQRKGFVSAGLVLTALFAQLAVGSGASAWAQQSSRTNPYTIPVNVRRVILDVVVTDAQRKAVLGLKRRDFTVTDDRAAQKILSFEAFNFDKVQPAPVAQLPDLPPDTYMNVPATVERGPLYVIVYDAVNMGHDDQIFARKQLAEFLASKPEGTRFELYVLDTDLRLLQGFTTQPDKLLQAFDVRRRDAHIPWVFLYGANYGIGDPILPFDAMAWIGKHLEGLPGRKNLVWMSSAFPVPFQGAGLDNLGSFGSTRGAGSAGMAETAAVNMDTVADEDALRAAADTLNVAQVSVYPIDVQGLNPEAGGGGIDLIAQELADDTGGRAYYNRNDLETAMLDATENGGSYYEISYAPTDSAYDGKLHQVRLSLGKEQKSDKLEYRRFYFADDPNQVLTGEERKYAEAVAGHRVAHQPGDTMYAYMERGAPMAHQILFRAHVSAGPAMLATAEQMANLEEEPAYFVVRKRNKPVKARPPIPLRKYTIDYLVLDAHAGPAGQQILEFAAGAYDASGKLLNGISQNAVRVESKGHDGAKDRFRAVQTLDIPATAVWLRVGVRDVRTDRIGTLEVRLPLDAEDRQTASENALPSTH